jgi:tetraacyldisaccharide 4'-kinase
LNQQTYRKLISGQSTGVAQGLLRCLLRLAAVGYAIGVCVRNFLYSREWLRVHRVDAAVISVGNITAGGTGKTPLAVWLCRQIIQNSKFQIADCRCAILTRGYKAAKDPRPKTQDYGDEVAILAENCPEGKVIVNPDRVAGAAEAISKFGAKVLIMDDGFQHRRLARDLDIVTVDATQPFGYGKLLPAGLLREPVTSLKRADAAVITRCDQVAEAELGELEKKLRTINPQMLIARSIHDPVCVEYPDLSVIPANAGIQKDGEKMDSCLRRNDSIRQLKGKKVFAFCGIGNPGAFLDTVKALGCELAGSKVYDDHYHHTEHSLADICEQAEHLGADLILTTQKDWTKIAGLAPIGRDMPLAYLAVEIKFLAGQDRLTSLIEETLAGKISQGR